MFKFNQNTLMHMSVSGLLSAGEQKFYAFVLWSKTLLPVYKFKQKTCILNRLT